MLESTKRMKEKVRGSPDSGAKIKYLIASLRSDDGVKRHEAREELVFMGKQAVDFLIPLLKDPDDEVRWEAAKALGEIADPRAAYGLADILLDHNFGIRWAAAEGLIAIGRDSLIPVLQKLTERPESAWLRRSAHHVLHDLAKRDPAVQEAVGAVLTALEGFEPEIGVLEPAYTALDRLKASRNWSHKA